MMIIFGSYPECFRKRNNISPGIQFPYFDINIIMTQLRTCMLCMSMDAQHSVTKLDTCSSEPQLVLVKTISKKLSFVFVIWMKN